MPRRARVVRREVPPDPRYGNRMVQKFINKVMRDGKKSVAERIVYTAFDLLERQLHRNPLDVFEQAVRNVTPVLEVKPRRVVGATVKRRDDMHRMAEANKAFAHYRW